MVLPCQFLWVVFQSSVLLFSAPSPLCFPGVFLCPASIRLTILNALRQLVDVAYAVMMQHVFDHVEHLASIDAKHGTRLRMENYLALEQGLQVCGQLPACG